MTLVSSPKPDPEGVKVISRWLSKATPPVMITGVISHPEGVPESG